MNPTKVLIADDNEGVRRMLTQCLRADDRLVLTAEDGDAALAQAREHLPDLIILDVRMPGRDGHQVCSQLREGESTRAIPILILTGLGECEAAYRGIGGGADAYLGKPFNFKDLMSRVSDLLGRRVP